jgi:hypothetical protein
MSYTGCFYHSRTYGSYAYASTATRPAANFLFLIFILLFICVFFCGCTGSGTVRP